MQIHVCDINQMPETRSGKTRNQIRDFRNLCRTLILLHTRIVIKLPKLIEHGPFGRNSILVENISPSLIFLAQGFWMSSKNHRPLTKMVRISRSDGVWRRPMVQNPSTSSHLATGIVLKRISPKQPKLSWFEVKNPLICKMLQLYCFTTHISNHVKLSCF